MGMNEGGGDGFLESFGWRMNSTRTPRQNGRVRRITRARQEIDTIPLVVFLRHAPVFPKIVKAIPNLLNCLFESDHNVRTSI